MDPFVDDDTVGYSSDAERESLTQRLLQKALKALDDERAKNNKLESYISRLKERNKILRKKLCRGPEDTCTIQGCGGGRVGQIGDTTYDLCRRHVPLPVKQANFCMSQKYRNGEYVEGTCCLKNKGEGGHYCHVHHDFMIRKRVEDVAGLL